MISKSHFPLPTAASPCIDIQHIYMMISEVNTGFVLQILNNIEVNIGAILYDSHTLEELKKLYDDSYEVNYIWLSNKINDTGSDHHKVFPLLSSCSGYLSDLNSYLRILKQLIKNKLDNSGNIFFRSYI